MAKTLMGAVVRANNIKATYKVVVLGKESVMTKDKDWSAEALQAATDIVKLCDDLTPEIGDIVGVQLYTEITDPTDGGVLVDLIFKDGNQFRVDAPPTDIAEARDALKALIGGEL